MQIYIAIRNQKTCKIQLNGATEKKEKKIKKHNNKKNLKYKKEKKGVYKKSMSFTSIFEEASQVEAFSTNI
jgi:hypothetical protein